MNAINTEGLPKEDNQTVTIWHQSYAPLDRLPKLSLSLDCPSRSRWASRVLISLYGASLQSAPDGPGDPRTDSAVREAGQAAERDNFDAFVLGCFYDPVLGELQQTLSIPVLGVLQQVALRAAAMGLPFAVVALSAPEAELAAEMVQRYGCGESLVASVALEPLVSEEEIDTATSVRLDDILASFTALCARMGRLGARVVIPGGRRSCSVPGCSRSARSARGPGHRPICDPLE